MTIDPRFLGDKNRQAHQDALVVRASMLDAESAVPTPEQRADEALRYATIRAMFRPHPDAPHDDWASYLRKYPSPVVHVDPEQGSLHTPAELSLGKLLDALPDNSPWLARLERCDEDFGRPLGDGLRLSRWTMVLLDMAYPNLWPDTRREWGKKLCRAVWRVYRKWLQTWGAG